jgi:hypothetical protein
MSDNTQKLAMSGNTKFIETLAYATKISENTRKFNMSDNAAKFEMPKTVYGNKQ